MDELVEPWVGAMQSRYVDAQTDLDGDGYGVLFETAPPHPGSATGFFNWGADATSSSG